MKDIIDCPYCSSDQTCLFQRIDDGMWAVYCLRCMKYVEGNSRDEVVREWNNGNMKDSPYIIGIDLANKPDKKGDN